jgi:hypothetical protein
LNVGYVLTQKNSKKKKTDNMSEDELAKHETILQKWEKDPGSCRNYLLNCLSEGLYDYNYDQSYSSVKKIWKALHKKYDTEEAGSKKYACSRFFSYQMVDGKSVVDQAYELQMIAHNVHSEGIRVDEKMQVTTVIDKLPESWKEYAKGMRHKQKKLSIEAFITLLQVEEEARNQDKVVEFSGANVTKVNLVTSNENFSYMPRARDKPNIMVPLSLKRNFSLKNLMETNFAPTKQKIMDLVLAHPRKM